MLTQIKGGLVVSCQALPDEPLHGSEMMKRMAHAAQLGGAVGIRANSVEDIRAIKSFVDLPIIGIIKQDYDDSGVYITATLKEVGALAAVGCDLIALDATDRLRPGGVKLSTFFKTIKEKFPDQKWMADCSTLEECVTAAELGFDCVGTTLIGYTPESKGKNLYDDDFAILKEIVRSVHVPVIAEGNILTPEMAAKALQYGAHSVVVGGAITRPQQITARFVSAVNNL